MADPAGAFSGARILIAEDEYLLADDLAQALRAAGATPVGPVATVAQAVERIHDRIDAAVLDMNLRGEPAFELAARLAAANIPCVIVSGYSERAMPSAIAGLRRLEKPVNSDAVVAALVEEILADRR